MDLQESLVENLNLAAHTFATSRWVVCGTYEGHSVAMKLAPFGSKRAKAMVLFVVDFIFLKDSNGYVQLM